MRSRLAILMAERDPRMSQRELAEKSRVSAMAVNRLYNNDFKRVDTETLEKLCAYLECDLSDLLVLKEEHPPKKNLAKTLAHSESSAQPKPDKLYKDSVGLKKEVRSEQQQEPLEEPSQFDPAPSKQPLPRAVLTVVPPEARETA